MIDFEQFHKLQLSCSCGKTHEGYTEFVILEPNGIFRLPQVCTQILCDGHVGVCYCESDSQIGARAVKELRRSGYRVTPILFASDVEMNREESDKLCNCADDIRLWIAVGNGELCQIVKTAAHARETEWIYFPTAPIGLCEYLPYAIRKQGISVRFLSARAPIAVIVDTDWIKKCKDKDVASGYGTIFARKCELFDEAFGKIVCGHKRCASLLQRQKSTIEEFEQQYESADDKTTLIMRTLLTLGLIAQMYDAPLCAGENAIGSSAVDAMANVIAAAAVGRAPHGVNKMIAACALSVYYGHMVFNEPDLLSVPADRVAEYKEISKSCGSDAVGLLGAYTELPNASIAKELHVYCEFRQDLQAKAAELKSDLTLALKRFRRLFEDAGFWLSGYLAYPVLNRLCRFAGAISPHGTLMRMQTYF